MFKLRYFFVTPLNGHFDYISEETWITQRGAATQIQPALDEIRRLYSIEPPYVYVHTTDCSAVLDLGLEECEDE